MGFESEVPEERGALLNDGAAIMLHFALLNDGAAIMFHFGIQDIGGGAYLFGAIMVTAQVEILAGGGPRSPGGGWTVIFFARNIASTAHGETERETSNPSLAPEKYMCRLLAMLFVESRQIYLFYRLTYCSIALWDNSAVNDSFFF